MVGGADLDRRLPARKPGVRSLGGPSFSIFALKTKLDAVGSSPGAVQALPGHSTAEITREIYLHAIPDDQRRAVKALGSLVFGFNQTQRDSTLSSGKKDDPESN